MKSFLEGIFRLTAIILIAWIFFTFVFLTPNFIDWGFGARICFLLVVFVIYCLSNDFKDEDS